ncbi:MAG: hypothetical protein AB1489_42945 [Acidobacteriota bacterium]
MTFNCGRYGKQTGTEKLNRRSRETNLGRERRLQGWDVAGPPDELRTYQV